MKAAVWEGKPAMPSVREVCPQVVVVVGLIEVCSSIASRRRRRRGAGAAAAARRRRERIRLNF
jgi:hypothetical protein